MKGSQNETNLSAGEEHACNMVHMQIRYPIRPDHAGSIGVIDREQCDSAGSVCVVQAGRMRISVQLN